MDKEWILFQLEEGLEQLQQTIEKINSDKEFCEVDFKIDMEHLYHHINTAWNSRLSSSSETKEQSDLDFKTLRQFPIDIDLST